MTQHPNSRANLNPKSHPTGYKKRTANGYWRVKLPKDYPLSHENYWQYTHIVVAEQNIEGGPRKLNPNERVYFINDHADKKDPQPGDIEVRIVSITPGKPPGRRSYWARRVIELEAKLEAAKEQLATHNVFYGRKPDDTSGAFETREWNGK